MWLAVYSNAMHPERSQTGSWLMAPVPPKTLESVPIAQSESSFAPGAVGACPNISSAVPWRLGRLKTHGYIILRRQGGRDAYLEAVGGTSY